MSGRDRKTQPVSEQNVMRSVMLALSRAGSVLFRNNVAQGVVGGVEWIRTRKSVVVNPGDAVVRGARVLHAGLIKGSADLVGWHTVTITPEMVGRKVAVFLSAETKAERGGRRTTEQVNWESQVKEAGGIAGFVRGADEAVALVREFEG